MVSMLHFWMCGFTKSEVYVKTCNPKEYLRSFPCADLSGGRLFVESSTLLFAAFLALGLRSVVDTVRVDAGERHRVPTSLAAGSFSCVLAMAPSELTVRRCGKCLFSARPRWRDADLEKSNTSSSERR